MFKSRNRKNLVSASSLEKNPKKVVDKDILKRYSEKGKHLSWSLFLT